MRDSFFNNFPSQPRRLEGDNPNDSVREHIAGALTPRQLDVLCELAKDQTNKRIAKALMLSPETVKHHLKAIFSKLGTSKREDAVVEAHRRAVIPKLGNGTRVADGLIRSGSG